MSVTAAQLLVRVQASGVTETKDALAGVSKEAQGAGEKSSGFLSTLAGFVTGASIVDTASSAFNFLKGQVVDSYQAGLQANDIMAQLTAGLKSTHDASGMTAQSLNDLAENIMGYSGISDNAVKSAESLFLTFDKIGSKTFPQATQAAADLATKMNGGAIPSSQQMQQAALQLGKALNDPTKGITALQRVGVSFSDQQKQQIAHFMKLGDVAGAQGVILKELNHEMGGSAKAAGQANGGIAILSAKFDDMKEKIGQALIPVVSKLFAAFAPVVNQLSAALPGALQAVSGFITSQMLPAVNNFSSWMKTDGAPLLQKLAEAFTANVLPAIKDVASFISGTLVPAVKNIAEKLADFTGFLQTHKDAMNAFKATLIGVAGAIAVSLVASFVSWAIAAGAAAIATIAATWPILAVGAGIALLVFGIKELVGHWGDISKFFGNVKNAIGDFFSHMGSMVHDLISKWTQAGHDIIQGLINGVTGMIGNAQNAVHKLGNSMLGSIKGLFGIHSPSTVFAEIGANMSQGLINGVKGVDVAGAVGKHMAGAVPSLSGSLNVGMSGGGSGLALIGRAPASHGVVAAGSSSTGMGGGGYAPGTPIVINIAGKRVAEVLLPEMVTAIRQRTGIRTM